MTDVVLMTPAPYYSARRRRHRLTRDALAPNLADLEPVAHLLGRRPPHRARRPKEFLPWLAPFKD